VIRSGRKISRLNDGDRALPSKPTGSQNKTHAPV
jgi:hypothetical protein